MYLMLTINEILFQDGFMLWITTCFPKYQTVLICKNTNRKFFNLIIYKRGTLYLQKITSSKCLCLYEYAAAAAAKLLQSCPTLCDPIDGSPPGSPIPGILQARTLEWVAISFSNAWKWSCSVVSDSATPWTAAYQDSLSMGFSRQEYWSGLPFPSPGDLPDPGIEPVSPTLAVDSLPLSHQGSPQFILFKNNYRIKWKLI